MHNPQFDRIHILLQQKKFTEAERIVKDMLIQDPHDVYLLSLMSELCLQQDKIDQAASLIDTAIGLSPDSPDLFFIKARILLQQDKYDEAENFLQQAIAMDPEEAGYFALWSSVKLSRKQFAEALDLANQALSIDAENILALNTRSTALLKLNRPEDAEKTISGALREDPNNPYTHANYGWNLLEKREHKKALEHFREALKLDPNFTYAQSGMLEALKANNIFYRLFLQYSFWMGNLTSKYQWGVIIGFFIGFRLLRALAASNENLRPYLTPIIILLALIMFSTWIITPVSNLFLRFNKYGKHLLGKHEKMSANFVGICFLIFILGLLAYLFLGNEKYLPVAVFGFAMMLPCSSMFLPSKNKNALMIYAVVMALVGLGSIFLSFQTGEIFNMFSAIFIIGFVAFQWVANYMLIRDTNV